MWPAASDVRELRSRPVADHDGDTARVSVVSAGVKNCHTRSNGDAVQVVP